MPATGKESRVTLIARRRRRSEIARRQRRTDIARRGDDQRSQGGVDERISGGAATIRDHKDAAKMARRRRERELQLDWSCSSPYTRSGDREERRRAGVTDGPVLNWDHV